MKFAIFAILTCVLFFSFRGISQGPTTERVLEPNGAPSKYTLQRFGKELTILATHKQGRGFIRQTTITDFDGDGKVDLAFVSGVTEDNERMFFQRRHQEGMKFEAEWQEEWEESVHRIEKLTGRKIQEGGAK